jgi:hypothetical protein
MKNLRTRFLGLTNTVTRFPITILFLLAATVLNFIVISTEENSNYRRFLFTFIIGAAVFTVLQMVYERFFKNLTYRILFMILSAASALLYLFAVRNSLFEIETSIRTSVLLFLLLIAFLWIPSMKSEISFNESFMAGFKAFFVALFFSGVLFLGVALILGALNMLIIPVDSTYYAHAANIIFVLYAPLYFFSLIPVYSAAISGSDLNIIDTEGKSDGKEGKESDYKPDIPENSVRKAGEAPRFLESLLSYVVIPVTAVFTVILLIYIVINITGEFWTDSLLEPLLVSYSITVIIVYLLTSRLQNKIADRFRRIFPKVLVPVVLFQTIASVIKIGDVGITYGRYYAILFGVFATIAGLIFCFLPVRKNGLIAPVLILLAILSILPPVDAFTVSRVSQTVRLKQILIENNMLSDNVITPNDKIPDADKQTIREIMSYLERMRYLDRIDWLSGYNSSEFYNTFGFSPYLYDGKAEYKNIYLYLKQGTPIDIFGYDYILDTNIGKDGTTTNVGTFEKNGRSFTLGYRHEDKTYLILLENEEELLRFPIDDIFGRYADSHSNGIEMTPEEATFTAQNERAILTLVTKMININSWQDGISQQAEAFILIKIK